MSEWRDALRKEILEYCDKKDTSEFELQDLLEFSEHNIKNKFPENDTWEASIRRTLQELRDNNELEFLGDGRYRRKALNISDDSINLPTPDSSLNYKLQYSLTHYNEAKSESNWEHPVIDLINSEVPNEMTTKIKEKCSLDPKEIENLRIEGSCGKGRMANIPWIGIFDNRVTNGPQEGLYVVYLFDTIENRLFLTLNQGMTELKNDYGLSATKKVLSTRAEILREKVELEQFEMSGIELPVQLLTGRNKHYGKSTICYSTYDADQFPSEEEIISDLCGIISEYNRIISDGYYNRLVSAFDENEEVQRYPNANASIEEQNSPTDREETQNEYWGLVSAKQSTGEKFIDSPTEDNLASFLEEFWTLRAAPSVEYILSEESNWFNQSPGEIAKKLKKAIKQNDISIATSINGFGVSSASEALRALEPTEFPILNDPAYQGMRSLGYNPKEPNNAKPEHYPEFVADIDEAIERYDLVQIADEADEVFVPEWATELQVADHLFYIHTDSDYEFTFKKWLPCDSTVETAPYYWVNQPAPADDKAHLKTVPNDSFDTDIGRLEVNDTVFHHDDGEVIGYSTVNQDPQTIKINDELGCKVDVSFNAFEEPVSFSDIFEYLLHEKGEDDTYFPVNASGLKSGYLFNLSEPAGNYILQQSKQDSPGASQIHRLEERLSQPDFSVSLPTGLYFHEREESRLKQQINASLNSGKHIIFTGPPGTGKSKLAKDVAEQAAYRHSQIDGHIFTTATAEWTTFDTIGGYVPDDGGDGLKFDPRLFLRCFRNDDGDIQNKWLVVDELNRANIDKALGPLFSVLAKDSVQLPYEDENRVQIDWVETDLDDEYLSNIANDQDRYPVTPSWWLIGTMNTVDKTSLYDLSFAFMRRFSFIHVGVPKLTAETEAGEIVSRSLLDPNVEGQNYATTWQQEQTELQETMAEYHEELSVIWAIVNKYRPIGPAIVLDILQHLHAHEGGDEDTPLTAAILSLVLPQMEGIREQAQLDLLDDLEKGLPIEASDNESDKNEIKLRVDFEYLSRKAYDMFDLDPDE